MSEEDIKFEEIEEILEFAQRRAAYLSRCIISDLLELTKGIDIDSNVYQYIGKEMFSALKIVKKEERFRLVMKVERCLIWLNSNNVPPEISILSSINVIKVLTKLEVKELVKTDGYKSLYSKYGELIDEYR